MLKDHIGNSIIRIKTTESTNNYASCQIADRQLESGSVFLAYAQTAGRGQLNNKWESVPGKNLTFSIYLSPEFLKIDAQFLLSKVVCLGLYDFLSQYVKNVSIKWPNDMYVDDKKIAGILIEHSIMSGKLAHTIIGVGLNINQEQFVSDAPNPVSLMQLIGHEIDLEMAIKDLLKCVDFYYQKLKEGDIELINSIFLKHMYRLNEWHYFKDDKGQFLGKIKGVNHFGQLIIEDKESREREYHFKQVGYLHGIQ